MTYFYVDRTNRGMGKILEISRGACFREELDLSKTKRVDDETRFQSIAPVSASATQGGVHQRDST